jgi:acetolactate synthase regulatory subunit
MKKKMKMTMKIELVVLDEREITTLMKKKMKMTMKIELVVLDEREITTLMMMKKMKKKFYVKEVKQQKKHGKISKRNMKLLKIILNE